MRRQMPRATRARRREAVPPDSTKRRFAYFHSLSKRNQAIYRASDAIAAVPLDEDMLPPLCALAARIQPALKAEKRAEVAKLTNQLVAAMCLLLDVQHVPVVVRLVRPSSHQGELHGLYTRHEDGRCQIEVWMRTAQQARVVAYRTYMRTLLHEVLHHLDYVLFELGDSFHNEGFFKRESDLVRRLVAATTREPKPAREAKPAREPKPKPAPTKTQLSFGF